MGQGIELGCPHCGYKGTFCLGIGFAYQEVLDELRAQIRKGKYGEEMMAFLKSNPDASIESVARLYQCNQCNHLEEQQDFCVSTASSQMKTKHFCSGCDAKMRRISNPFNAALPCENCGHPLEQCGYFMWD